MATIKNRIGREHQDKRLRVAFSDGEIAEIKLLLVSDCNEHQSCNGITYEIISTNRTDRIEKGATYWSESSDVKAFEALGD
jgi:hypothetical protein